MDDQQFLTADQAAERLQVHSKTVKRLLNQGKLPGQKVGSQWRISAESLRKYIEGDKQSEEGKGSR